MTLHEIKNEIRSRLTPFVGSSEAEAMAKMILEEIKGYSPVELVIHSNRELLPETINRLNKITDRVANGEPLQYVLGRMWWQGRKFIVNPSVLIPRPETSQLVDMIVDENNRYSDLSVLDIGTGSGCIAVTLALDLPYSEVTAIDISMQAINTAETNAKYLNARVDFKHIDVNKIAESDLADKSFDIIVSNPPYVLESERDSVDPRVKDHEPEIALFVDDRHSVDIYHKIIEYSATNLKDGGKLYLEINPLCDQKIKEALEGAGFTDAEILTDYNGIKRFAKARRR